MANEREEQLRNNRRLARQFVGAVALALMLIGLLTVLGWVVAGVRAALDDTDERRAYEDKLYGLVLFDVLPFESVDEVDPAVFREAAIWGTLYQIQNRVGGLESYERDTASGSLILPQLEVDTYLTSLLGPDYPITDGPFETSAFVYSYDEEKQGYLVPVTGSVGLYTPQVARISTRGGLTYVTVGYVPTINNISGDALLLTAPTEPTKYMDYVFARGDNRQWYLQALQESEMQPPATPAPTAVVTPAPDPQTLVQDNLGAELTGGTAAEAAPADGEAAPAEGETAPADGEAAPAESEDEEAAEEPEAAPAEESPEESSEDSPEDSEEGQEG